MQLQLQDCLQTTITVVETTFLVSLTINKHLQNLKRFMLLIASFIQCLI